ncbi:hypothetical protein [Paenibacillus sp.]|uniref:ATP-grasp domain-containing protein n=1 Tax=Paenibacillus sp. TaxID=58172 RepID=UPI002D4D85D4|nr:hypothetical protein [Paenibacillus sp.]HZG88199.1 hypothetical protein [Paenibacillus sp.]
MARFISFNAYRTIGIPDVCYIKPSRMFQEIDAIQRADAVLFPETWQVPSLVYGLKKPIFPSIETMQLGFSKIEMTRALWTVAPQHVPYTEIWSNTEENRRRILETFGFPFVAKEARNSMGRGVFLIRDEADFRRYADASDALYVQEYLPNEGKDLRICVVGDDVFAAYWRIGAEGEFLHNVARGGGVCFDFVPQEACELVLRVARQLNINHAGFDVLVSGGSYYILEFNVLFGNQGLISEGLSVENAITEYLERQFTPFPHAPNSRGKIIS